LADQKLMVVDDWKLDSHKTKAFRASLSKLDGDSRTILLVNHGANLNLQRASRNLEGVTVVPPNELHTYDLMRHEKLILSRESAEKISRALSSSASGAAPEAPVQAQGELAASSESGAKPKMKAKAPAKPSASKASKPRSAAKAAKPKSKKE